MLLFANYFEMKSMHVSHASPKGCPMLADVQSRVQKGSFLENFPTGTFIACYSMA